MSKVMHGYVVPRAIMIVRDLQGESHFFVAFRFLRFEIRSSI